MGLARGTGEVVLSPKRGCRFTSKRASDVAFALTCAPLPIAYRVTVEVENVDTYKSGSRFGIFEGRVRYGGNNEFVNSTTKYAVVFQEHNGARDIYVWYYGPSGDFFCWAGRMWRRNSWRPSGVRWSPQHRYKISFTKSVSTFACEIRQGKNKCLAPKAVSVADVRGAGQHDYFAFGDLVTDFVYGEMAVSSVAVEEIAMRPYLDLDMQHVVVSKAPSGRYAMYGGLTKLGGREIVCVFKVGSLDPKTGSPWTVRDETVVWTRSPDQGRTWQQAENLIYQDKSTRQETCCGTGHFAKDGTLMHPFYILNADYEERAKANNWSRLHLAESKDRAQTWTARQLRVPLAMPASFGGIVKLRDDTLLLNVYGTAELGTFRHQAGIARSTDDGQTWADYSIIGSHADPDGGPARLNETDVVQLADGKLLTMSRTQYPGFPLYRGVSTDLGRKWTVDNSGLTGLCPALCATQCGPAGEVVALVYHDRWGKHANEGGIYVTFSTDEGATWGEPVWISAGAYPCLIEIEPGRLFCTYYQSNALLRGTFFSVPFPTGLRIAAQTSTAPGLTLAWDAYGGSKAAEYTYHVHRGAEPRLVLNDESRVGNVRGASRFRDEPLQAGKVYYYRVAAYQGDRRVGLSWVVAGRAAGGP